MSHRRRNDSGPQKLPSSEPHVDLSSTNKEDEAVTVVEMMLVEALRASAANKDTGDQPPKPLTEGEVF